MDFIINRQQFVILDAGWLDTGRQLFGQCQKFKCNNRLKELAPPLLRFQKLEAHDRQAPGAVKVGSQWQTNPGQASCSGG